MSSYEKEPESQESKSTLWMGELEPWYDENAIRQIWQAFGENVAVKMIRDKFNGVNAGYCFVDFGTAAAATKALTLNGQPIPNTNRVFRLNWASGGGLVDKRDDRGPEYSIFVGDLSPEVSEMSLFQLFQSRYPSCKSAKIMTDSVTNASRGYGFVRFSDESHMMRALTEMQGFFLGNRPIRISTATPKSKPGMAVGNPAAMAGGPGGAGVGAHANSGGIYLPPQVGYYGGAAAQPINQFTDPNNTTVFVGGLSSQVTEDELRRYFAGFGDITYVRIPVGKGCGFVQFVHRQSAEAAIAQMQGYPIANSRVRLSWGRSQNSNSVGGVPGPYRPAQPNVYSPMSQQYSPYAPVNPQAAHSHVPQQNAAQADGLLPVTQDASEPVPVARLNELYLAARDGRLDRMEADGRGYHGVYAQ